MFFIIFVLILLPITNALNCSSKKEVGFFCEQPSSKMFYYDSRYKVCQPFQYRGCGGNDNQFNTAQECREQCSNGGRNENSTQVTGAGENESGVDTVFRPLGTGHDQWLKAEKCGSNFLIPNGKYIKCGSGCPSNHSCIMGVCCPSEDYVCSLIDDTGSFVDGINDKPRFGWNHQVKSCVRFSYYGANGNYNNFPNFYSCINYCKNSKPLK